MPPPDFADRVVAAWRAPRPSLIGGNEAVSVAAIFRQAAVWASVAVVLSVAWSYLQNRGSSAGASEMVTYARNLQIPP